MSALNRMCDGGRWTRAVAVRVMLTGQGLILAGGMWACAAAGVL